VSDQAKSRARTLIRASIIACAGLFLAQTASAATIVVTGTADNLAVDGAVSLREAIASINAGANVNADVVAVGTPYGTGDVINFAIPGAGVHTIALASALPAVIKPVEIDGYTQAGSSVNTNGTSAGSNAVLVIELDMANASLGPGLTLAGGASVVRGLVVNRAFGVAIALTSDGNFVTGNFIGTNPAGTAGGPGNTGDGIFVNGANNTIGGFPPADRNVISANGVGIRVTSVSGNTIAGNLIGTNAAGTAGLGNFGQGITAGGSNIIGGGTAAERNVVSGNGQQGVHIVGSGSIVRGNYVGTNVTGTAAIPNQHGIDVVGSINTVGGTLAGEGNLVSGNTLNGISIIGQSNPNGVVVLGNRVGTDASGTAGIPGQLTAGINIGPFSNGNTIGGTPGGNIVAFNSGAGIFLSGAAGTAGTGNLISGNSIHSNTGGLGIKLNTASSDPPAANDAGDADNGANRLQNYPVITSGAIGGGNLTVSATLNSTANSTFRVELFSNAACDPLGNGEGQSFLGFANVTTDGAGNATLAPTVLPVPAGQPIITATATNTTTSDTSEFSACFAAAAPTPTMTIDDVTQLEGNAGTTAFVFTVSISASADATVNFATANGTANAASDYTSNAGTVTFTSGGPLTQTITILVSGDTLVEPDETFFVNLTNAVGATIADAQGVGTILNDDGLATPTVSIGNVTRVEGNSGTTGFGFSVSISSSGNATVNFATADGTASAGSDYAGASGTVTFTASGPLTQTITILVNGDTQIETDETFFVNLSGAIGATIASGQGVGTIVNDDGTAPRPAVTIPTLGEYALVALAALLAMLAFPRMRRRT
jgi:Calx-beta domain-containing protein/exosortase sorting signal-containing protein